MISRRTVLLYNLGLALTLVVCGLLAMYALNLLGHAPGLEAAQASAQARTAKEIIEDEDIEHLRSTASYYLRLSQDLKRARYSDNVSVLEDIRYGCLLLAGTFVIGGLIGFGAAGARSKERPGQGKSDSPIP